MRFVLWVRLFGYLGFWGDMVWEGVLFAVLVVLLLFWGIFVVDVVCVGCVVCLLLVEVLFLVGVWLCVLLFVVFVSYWGGKGLVCWFGFGSDLRVVLWWLAFAGGRFGLGAWFWFLGVSCGWGLWLFCCCFAGVLCFLLCLVGFCAVGSCVLGVLLFCWGLVLVGFRVGWCFGGSFVGCCFVFLVRGVFLFASWWVVRVLFVFFSFVCCGGCVGRVFRFFSGVGCCGWFGFLWCCCWVFRWSAVCCCWGFVSACFFFVWIGLWVDLCFRCCLVLVCVQFLFLLFGVLFVCCLLECDSCLVGFYVSIGSLAVLMLLIFVLLFWLFWSVVGLIGFGVCLCWGLVECFLFSAFLSVGFFFFFFFCSGCVSCLVCFVLFFCCFWFWLWSFGLFGVVWCFFCGVFLCCFGFWVWCIVVCVVVVSLRLVWCCGLMFGDFCCGGFWLCLSGVGSLVWCCGSCAGLRVVVAGCFGCVGFVCDWRFSLVLFCSCDFFVGLLFFVVLRFCVFLSLVGVRWVFFVFCLSFRGVLFGVSFVLTRVLRLLFWVVFG